MRSIISLLVFVCASTNAKTRDNYDDYKYESDVDIIDWYETDSYEMQIEDDWWSNGEGALNNLEPLA